MFQTCPQVNLSPSYDLHDFVAIYQVHIRCALHDWDAFCSTQYLSRIYCACTQVHFMFALVNIGFPHLWQSWQSILHVWHFQVVRSAVFWALHVAHVTMLCVEYNHIPTSIYIMTFVVLFQIFFRKKLAYLTRLHSIVHGFYEALLSIQKVTRSSCSMHIRFAHWQTWRYGWL